MKLADDFYISQTLIKKLEDYSTCKKSLYYHMLSKEYESIPTPPMEAGVYFETKCLGSGVNGKKMEELPSATKLTLARLEAQASYFDEMFNPHSDKYIGLTIVDRDVEYINNITDSQFYQRGVGDFEVVSDEKWMYGEGKKYICDLKLTGSIMKTYVGKPEWSWKDPSKRDYIQQYLYEDLSGKDVDGSILFVFDYSPDLNKSMIILPNTDDEKREEIHSRILSAEEKVVDILSNYSEKTLPVKPSFRECSMCGYGASGKCSKMVEKGRVNIFDYGNG